MLALQPAPFPFRRPLRSCSCGQAGSCHWTRCPSHATSFRSGGSGSGSAAMLDAMYVAVVVLKQIA